MKCLLAITTTLLPLAVSAQQFTPQQMLDAMTKSPSNRNARVHDRSESGGQLIKLSEGVNYEPRIPDVNGNNEINFSAK